MKCIHLISNSLLFKKWFKKRKCSLVCFHLWSNMNSKNYCYKDRIMSQLFPQSLQLWTTVLNDIHFFSLYIMQCFLTVITLSHFQKVVFHVFFYSHRFSKGLFQKALGKHEWKREEIQYEYVCYPSIILLLSISQADYASCKI